MRRNNSPDRYLQRRPDGGYRYVRRIPADVRALLMEYDPDLPEYVRRSLDTDSLETARARRDAMEAADDEYWASLHSNDTPRREHYERVIARARSLKLQYLPAEDLVAHATLEEILQRIAMVAGREHDRVTVDAALGGAEEPMTTLDEAFAVFENAIRKTDLARKSDWQRKKWRQLKQRGLTNFKQAVGDIPIEAITREHATKFYEFWLKRIVPDDPDVKPLSASAGNKDMDTMRALYGEYMDYVGKREKALANPFAGLRFRDRIEQTRPPFSERWIRTKILKAGALDGLNDEARVVVLVLINTGARPSEIVNLTADRIVLSAKIPHIDIRETRERELKAASSARRIPLVGVSLEAMKEMPAGFPRYRDKDTLSGAVNKFFRENGLLETPAHSLYSFRHSFEARLKLAQVDEELRRYLMGHSIKRPKYGYSDDLSWALAAIEKVAL